MNVVETKGTMQIHLTEESRGAAILITQDLVFILSYVWGLGELRAKHVYDALTCHTGQ